MAMASEDFPHVEKLKGHSNFNIWKFQIVVLFKAADLYNVARAEFREGEQDTNWGEKDAKAQRYIVTTIDKGNIQFIMSCDSAKRMFDKLCSIYVRDSSPNKTFVIFARQIYTFLTACESTPKSDRTLTNLTARFLAEEERGHTSSTHDNVAFKTVNKNIVYYKCNKRDHICPELHEKNRYRNNKSTISNRDKVAFLTDSMGGNPEESWVLDSGCASHMINNSDSLTNVTVDTTPAELWYGKRPDLSNIKLFGSLAYAKKFKMLGKLYKRCDNLIMVGYWTNGYRLWNSEKREIKLPRYATLVESTEVSTTNNSPQEIITDTDSLVDSEETSLRLADNMEVRRNTTVLKVDVVDEPFHVFPSDQDTAKTSEMLDFLPETATEIENCNHQGRKERIKRKPQYLQEYVILTYKEAISGEDKDKLLKAIEEEKSSLNKNGVFQFVDDDNRYKATLVARGCEQKAGLYYSETSSSVVSLNTLRFLIAYAKKENMSLKKFDIKTAFLYGNLEQDVFMLVPEGFEDEQGSVAKLNKSRYGLKPAPRA
ncbi:hypothetical protein PR048_024680 [Dryococelus australis]|uniref:Reverse transcriptase Ty1/copia-type domain-containing protein n=1 Tax=Dryococelus australis TaxID=614101 RepID=A0ABQ9GP90_9NEOP|nr:hypothetical protein PR048_024680 [Dryococelus australis]